MRFKRNILIWLLSWSILILMVIYSPIGSPELYVHDQYLVYHQGVNFNGSIANSSQKQTYGSYEEPDPEIPDYTPEKKSYTINTSYVTKTNFGHPGYSVTTSSSTDHIVLNKGSVGPGTMGGFTFITSHKNAQGKFAPQTGVIAVLNSDLTLNETSATTRQLATEASDGGTDPGGDPEGAPIPVGDGFWFLLILAGGYILRKINIQERNEQNNENKMK